MKKLIKTTFGKILAIGLSAAVIIACDSSEDPSLANVDIQLRAVSSQGAINPGGRTASTSAIEFNEFYIGVTEIEFETEMDNMGSDDDDYEIEFEGRFVVDALNGTSTPDFGIADLAPGLYHEIEIEMEPVLGGGNTLDIKATYTVNGQEYPVEFLSDESFELEIEDDEGFMLDEGSLKSVLILIDLDILFNGVDLSVASVDGDGVIRLNDESNAGITSMIENNLENALDALDDDDDDYDDYDDNDDDDDDSGDDD